LSARLPARTTAPPYVAPRVSVDGLPAAQIGIGSPTLRWPATRAPRAGPSAAKPRTALPPQRTVPSLRATIFPARWWVWRGGKPTAARRAAGAPRWVFPQARRHQRTARLGGTAWTRCAPALPTRGEQPPPCTAAVGPRLFPEPGAPADGATRGARRKRRRGPRPRPLAGASPAARPSTCSVPARRRAGGRRRARASPLTDARPPAPPRRAPPPWGRGRSAAAAPRRAQSVRAMPRRVAARAPTHGPTCKRSGGRGAAERHTDARGGREGSRQPTRPTQIGAPMRRRQCGHSIARCGTTTPLRLGSCPPHPP